MFVAGRVIQHRVASSAWSCSTLAVLRAGDGPLLMKNDAARSSLSTLAAQGFERDNRTKNRQKAKELDPGGGRPISKKLSKCRTTKEFVEYARSKGAAVKINSNHAKVTKNNVTTGFASIGTKKDVQYGARKQKIEAFKAMGIAWDD